MVPGSTPIKNGLEHPGVLDAMAHDTAEDKLVLVMYETRPWQGEDSQLLQLQEKLNAYLSFVLDGEMTQAFPQMKGKPVEIQLRTKHLPDMKSADLMRRMREQLEFQKIGFQVSMLKEEHTHDHGHDHSGGGCGCSC